MNTVNTVNLPLPDLPDCTLGIVRRMRQSHTETMAESIFAIAMKEYARQAQREAVASKDGQIAKLEAEVNRLQAALHRATLSATAPPQRILCDTPQPFITDAGRALMDLHVAHSQYGSKEIQDLILTNLAGKPTQYSPRDDTMGDQPPTNG